MRAPGDSAARAWAIEASELLRGQGSEDALRAAARRLVWAPETVDDRAVVEGRRRRRRARAPPRAGSGGEPARAAFLAGAASRRRRRRARRAPARLVDVPAPLGSRGPTLDAAVRLATDAGDGDAARRFELARAAAARALHDGTPAELRASLAAVAWARATPVGAADVAFAPAQVLALEGIVRALSRARRPAPPARAGARHAGALDGRRARPAAPARARRAPRAARGPQPRSPRPRGRAARALADHRPARHRDGRRGRRDRRAVDPRRRARERPRAAACAACSPCRSSRAARRSASCTSTTASERGRSARRELAWVRVVASQAAMAIADARDAVLLRRAARRAERARVRVEGLLARARDRARGDAHRARARPRRRREPLPLRRDRRPERADARSPAPGRPRDRQRRPGAHRRRERHRQGAHRARDPRQRARASRRAFVTENCASVPESLLESTLFGHVRGAFTGASSHARGPLRRGRRRHALSRRDWRDVARRCRPSSCACSQDGEVRAVGGERARRVDVRVIGATHRDLEAMVAAGTFREDLFYRLNVITLRVPPLRERPEDIPLLFEHFAHEARRPSRAVKVTRAAMAKLIGVPLAGQRAAARERGAPRARAGRRRDRRRELSADVARGGPAAARGSGLHLRTRVDALESSLVRRRSPRRAATRRARRRCSACRASGCRR